MLDKLILIDGNSLLFRSFYALPLLHTKQGEYTNAVYGFLLMLKKLLKEEQPTHLVVAFDKKRKNFRNEIYAEYKGQRSEAPDELVPQFALIREVLGVHQIPFVEIDDYEADDIIGTISAAADRAEIPCLIVSGDRDVLQLITDTTTVMFNKKGITDIERYDADKVLEKMGVRVDQIIDLKALMGDSSDNIPGVPGIGPKTATKLLQSYDTLEGLFEHLDELKGKLKENLSVHRELAFISRLLSTIVCDVPIDCELEQFSCKVPNWQKLTELYRRLEFKQFMLEARKAVSEQVTTDFPDSGSLFAVSRPQTELTGIPLLAPLQQDMQGSLFAEESYCVIDSSYAWEKFLKQNPEPKTGIYFEPENQHPMWQEVKEIWIAKGRAVALVPLEKFPEGFCWLADFWADPNQEKFFFNSKFCRVEAKRKRIEMSAVAGDLMLLAYVMDPSFSGETLFEILDYYQQVIKDSMPLAEQVVLIVPLYQKLYADLEPKLKELLDNMELPAAEALAEMEYAGIHVDRSILAELHEELAVRIKVAAETIYALAGHPFNIQSPKQLGVVLFEELGLPVIKKTKSGYGTGAEILEQLTEHHEIAADILLYRQLSKLQSTYIDALPQLIHPETGRVHTIFKQAMTATGRLSSVEPNLQNIPVRMEEGRRIRRAFTGRDETMVLLSADYSQIDLRVLAHISQDENLIETFRQNIDVHTRTAAEIFKVGLEDVDADMRRRAKAVNFGIIYGISAFGLSRDTGVSQNEAKQYIQEYLDAYPGVQHYMHNIVEEGKAKGYVETIFHRRRYLPDLAASNKMLQSFARRMALNTPIQGTSADLMKLAMINISRKLKEIDFSARMLLQVHDELVFEVEPAYLLELAAIVRQMMEMVYPLAIPLLTTLKTGANWYDMKSLEI